jgi:hypothetical protein
MVTIPLPFCPREEVHQHPALALSPLGLVFCPIFEKLVTMLIHDPMRRVCRPWRRRATDPSKRFELLEYRLCVPSC